MHQTHINVKIIKLVSGEDVVTVLPTGKNQLPEKSTLIRLERSPRNLTTQSSWLPMGLSAQALIYGICITLFLLVLLNLA